MSIDTATRTTAVAEATSTTSGAGRRNGARPAVTRARTVLGIVGAVAVAAAALGAVTDDADGTSTNNGGITMESGRTQGSQLASTIERTDLDARGIPTWWTAGGASGRHQTDLDERGVPTWWAG